MFCECRDYATALVWSDWLRLFGGPVGQSPRSGWFHRVCGSSRLRQNHNSPRCGRKHVQGAAGVLTGQTDHCSGSDKENEWYEWYEWYWTFEFWGTHGVLYLWTKPFLCHFSSDRRTCLFISPIPNFAYIYIYLIEYVWEMDAQETGNMNIIPLFFVAHPHQIILRYVFSQFSWKKNSANAYLS